MCVCVGGGGAVLKLKHNLHCNSFRPQTVPIIISVCVKTVNVRDEPIDSIDKIGYYRPSQCVHTDKL